ncbi:tail assembly protein [Cronobacter turicensis]|uniref:tail assembly protein n=1 Tax=Cronobacter dublinensis TaxID=413497 RepID=UPI001411B6CA|nr:tail assembly protein [Cronobacter dublinensis]ELY4574937.1 tail assembly protein [Cronobacter turicensis]ELY7546150.1 tail assembly protein [Cronobacter turicensis]NHV90001.1 tail assembly protein [Cronobacter dublinensis]
MNQLKTVRLYGALGVRFGREHRLVISSPAEACRALSVIIPGFEQYMQTAHLRGLRFAVFRGKKNIGQDELKHNSGEADIRIAPVIAGSKRAGVLQTILGAVLVVVGAIGMTIGQAWGGATWGPYALQAGIGLMAGGVVQMLSPQPGGLASRQDPDNAPSYAFGGPVNTTAMGNPVGLLYGEREIGGAIVSAGIYTNDQ